MATEGAVICNLLLLILSVNQGTAEWEASPELLLLESMILINV